MAGIDAIGAERFADRAECLSNPCLRQPISKHFVI